MSNDMIVHVVDDDEALRDSLRFLLESADLTVRTYDSAVEFLKEVSGIETGCVVTDVRMPEMTGIELLKQLKEQGCTLPVVVITGHGDVPLAVEAMKIGALDFFEKPFDDEALLAAVRSALTQNATDSKQEADKADILQRLSVLSARERQVLAGVVAGKANKNIAFDLGISPRTVEIYRANVMTKMQAKSVSELVRMTLITGTIDTAET